MRGSSFIHDVRAAALIRLIVGFGPNAPQGLPGHIREIEVLAGQVIDSPPATP
jgi:hypothetical protein